MNVKVSVVVPTYKRPDLLRKCLDALLRQDFPFEAYEIVIVDDAGSDETRLLVEYFSSSSRQTGAARESGRQASRSPHIRYVPAIHTRGPAAARNLGWRIAAGEIIAFTDDDCLPEPDWLKQGVAALKANVDAVSGQVVVPTFDNPTDYEKNISRLMTDCEFVTANCFIRRAALEAASGFDERFTSAWREDSDLQFRMLKLSCNLIHAPAAKVIHPVRDAPWGVSVKEQRKSMFNALLFKKHPDLYRKHIQARPPLRYYAIVLSLVGFFAALLSGHGYVALLMVLIWAGLTIQFALQRLQDTRHSPGHIAEMLFTSILIPPLSVFWRLYGAFYYRVLFF